MIKALRSVVLVSGALLGLPLAAYSATIVNDTWTDGTRTDPAPPVYSENGTDSDADGSIESAWFLGAPAGATLTASAGHLVGTVAASSVHWTTYFTPESNPVTLVNSGDQIRITWVFTATGVNLNNTNQDFRLAVVDTPAGLRLTSDATASAASGYTGYGMFMNLGQTLGGANPFQLGRRVAATSAVLLGNASDYTLLTNGAASGKHGYDSGTTYTYVMTLTRNGTGLNITSTMTGGSLNGTGTATVSYTDPTPPGFTFDTFHVRPSTGSSTTASSFDTTLFRVEFIAANSAPMVQFATTASAGLETVSPAVLNVTLSQVMTQAVTVSYAATGGTATNGGVDYLLAPGTLTFNPGETNKTISIPITNDGLADNGETIVVTLTGVITESPTLQIGRSVGGVVLSWPQSYPGFTLESRPDLMNLPYWAAVTNMVAISNGLNQVAVSLTGPSQYYRLRGPSSAGAQLGTQYKHTYTILEGNQPVVSAEYVGSSFSPYNHGSSIAQTSDGSLVATWYGGSAEGASDVSIWVSRNAGSGWSPRVEVDSGPPTGGATWNPVLFQPKAGPLLLYYKYGGSYSGGWEGSVRTSFDNGITWSARIPLPTSTDPSLSAYNGRFIGPVKNRPLELPDGRLLCGSSTENNGWQVHMEIAGTTNNYTTDYQLIQVAGGNAIQPTFLVHDDSYQTIQAICRPNVGSSSGGLAMNTWSHDGGNTWSSLSNFPLTVEGGLHALTINNLNSAQRRWHVLAYNASSTRDPLKIAISQDGTNWVVAIPSLDSGNKMDYPTLMQSSDKLLHVVYSYYGHTKIKHVVLDPYVLLNEPRP